jgi:hypothetical protein
MNNEEQDIGDESADLKTGQGHTPTFSTMYQGIVERAGNARAALAEKLQVPAVWTEIVPRVFVLCDEDKALHYQLSEAARVMLAVAGELSKGSRRAASDIELMERLHDEARAVLALVNKPDTNSANSDHPAHGQASETKDQA